MGHRKTTGPQGDGAGGPFDFDGELLAEVVPQRRRDGHGADLGEIRQAQALAGPPASQDVGEKPTIWEGPEVPPHPPQPRSRNSGAHARLHGRARVGALVACGALVLLGALGSARELADDSGASHVGRSSSGGGSNASVASALGASGPIVNSALLRRADKALGSATQGSTGQHSRSGSATGRRRASTGTVASRRHGGRSHSPARHASAARPPGRRRPEPDGNAKRARSSAHSRASQPSDKVPVQQTETDVFQVSDESSQPAESGGSGSRGVVEPERGP